MHLRSGLSHPFLLFRSFILFFYSLQSPLLIFPLYTYIPTGQVVSFYRIWNFRLSMDVLFSKFPMEIAKGEGIDGNSDLYNLFHG